MIATFHAFGGLADEDHKFSELGSDVGRRIANNVDYDPLTGIPRMSNIPVRTVPGWSNTPG